MAKSSEADLISALDAQIEDAQGKVNAFKTARAVLMGEDVPSVASRGAAGMVRQSGRGGARPGAGRPAGKRGPGRPPGSVTRRSSRDED